MARGFSKPSPSRYSADMCVLLEELTAALLEGRIRAKCVSSGYPRDTRYVERTPRGVLVDFCGGSVEFITEEAYAEEEEAKRESAARRAALAGAPRAVPT